MRRDHEQRQAIYNRRHREGVARRLSRIEAMVGDLHATLLAERTTALTRARSVKEERNDTADG